MQQTHLVQITTKDVEHSTQIFQKRYGNNSVPLVVVVTPPKCCCYCKLNIPSGVVTLGQKWGAHEGTLQPGAKCCYCSHRRIAAIITQNSIRYDAPIRDCPTKDNVKVSIDISLTFRIGPGDEEYRTFVYELGPAKLDELLAAESEEAIRNFIRGKKLSVVQDIKGEIADSMLVGLNSKFNQLGVYFENVQIMTIQIPPQLRKDLAETTSYDTKLQNQIKKHENDKLTLTNSENQKLIQLQRDNNRELERLKAQKKRALIQRDEQMVNQEAETEVEVTQAEQEAQTLLTRANGDKAVAENESKKNMLELINQQQTKSSSKKIEIDKWAEIEVMKSEASLESAKSRYEAMLMEARAEAEQIGGIEANRKHELRLEKARVMQKLAQQCKLIFTGDTGDAFLKGLIENINE